MDEIRLKCDGLIIGSRIIPPFELRTGQSVSLQMAAPHDLEEEQLLRNAFSGAIVHAEIHVLGHIVSADPAHPRAGLLAKLVPESALGWLAKNGGIPRSDAERAIQLAQACNPEDKLPGLAMTPRTTLGLLAAWAN